MSDVLRTAEDVDDWMRWYAFKRMWGEIAEEHQDIRSSALDLCFACMMEEDGDDCDTCHALRTLGAGMRLVALVARGCADKDAQIAALRAALREACAIASRVIDNDGGSTGEDEAMLARFTKLADGDA